MPRSRQISSPDPDHSHRRRSDLPADPPPSSATASETPHVSSAAGSSRRPATCGDEAGSRATNHAERTTLIADLRRLWEGWSDLRFGQMLRVAVGDPADSNAGDPDDHTLADGLSAALRDHPGGPAPRGPYWDTETRGSRTFMNGLPRDPARIPHVVTALAAAWDVTPTVSLGQTIVPSLDYAQIPENEFNSRRLLIEDGPFAGSSSHSQRTEAADGRSHPLSHAGSRLTDPHGVRRDILRELRPGRGAQRASGATRRARAGRGCDRLCACKLGQVRGRLGGRRKPPPAARCPICTMSAISTSWPVSAGPPGT
jgi:hypothetical protein